MDGLDAAQGLRRVAGNRKLYLSLLRQFLDEPGGRRGADPREPRARASGRWPSGWPTRSRGRRGNLAAGPVQAAAGALEKAIRDGVDAAGVESLRRELGEALGRLSSALGPWLAERIGPRRPAPVDTTPVDPAALKGVVERWARLLAECDAGASDDLEREGDELRALFGGARASPASPELVTAYDFDGALEALRRAAGERGL